MLKKKKKWFVAHLIGVNFLFGDLLITSCLVAPEVVDLSGLVPASDMWGVACTIFELLTGFPPYFDLNPMTAMFKIVEGGIPPFPEGITQVN
jgi:serine/threonine protein kinase